MEFLDKKDKFNKRFRATSPNSPNTLEDLLTLAN